MNLNLIKPCVIGLGYVGLPILINLSKKYKTVGYDISDYRVQNLKKGLDI
jgi:UDP-N-acetyl-D-galactosamine dehydrogenase